MSRQEFNLVFKNYQMITPKVRHMTFVREGDAKLVFVPGQFITFHFEIDGETFNRSYSVASIPTQTDAIEIAVSPFPGGPGTEFLFHLKPGDKVKTTGPFGRLVLREEMPKRYILVATGTGVTPYRAMLPELHLRLQKSNLEVIILEGVQTPEDLLYGKDFWEFSSKHPNLHFHAYYSRFEPNKTNPYEHHGYVQSYFNQINLDPENDIIYLCGNPDMIDQSFNLLLDKGFSVASLRREKYISPKKLEKK